MDLRLEIEDLLARLRGEQARLGSRALDFTVLAELDALERAMAHCSRMLRILDLPLRPTRIPVDPSKLLGRVCRAARTHATRVELVRPPRDRVLIDPPTFELVLRCTMDALTSAAPSGTALVVTAEVEADALVVSLHLRGAHGRLEPLPAVPKSTQMVLDVGFERSGFDWTRESELLCARSRGARSEPSRRFVFPVPASLCG